MRKMAFELIEQALAIHHRALDNGPMPDQMKLARVILPFTVSTCDRHRETASKILILTVRDMLHDMLLNFKCEVTILKILKDLLPQFLPSVGLAW